MIIRAILCGFFRNDRPGKGCCRMAKTLTKTNEKRFTKTEKSWIMYDWANSVYATNILAVIFPIYFGNVCQQNGADNLVL